MYFVLPEPGFIESYSEPGPSSTLFSLSTPSTPSTSNMLPLTPLLSRPLPTNCRVNWDRMPAGIRTAVVQDTRPSAGDRRVMVRLVVDQMSQQNLNLSRAICHNVVRSIIREYPRSFTDVYLDEEVFGHGFGSLLNQIKTRVEHVNRYSTLARRRVSRRKKHVKRPSGPVRVC